MTGLTRLPSDINLPSLWLTHGHTEYLQGVAITIWGLPGQYYTFVRLDFRHSHLCGGGGDVCQEGEGGGGGTQVAFCSGSELIKTMQRQGELTYVTNRQATCPYNSHYISSQPLSVYTGGWMVMGWCVCVLGGTEG